MKIDALANELENFCNTNGAKLRIVEKTWADLASVNYTGVYVLCQADDVVYIGSGYSQKRKMRKRLGDHVSRREGKSALLKKLAKVMGLDVADRYIRSLRLFVIEYQDLEEALIAIADPKHNANHKKTP